MEFLDHCPNCGPLSVVEDAQPPGDGSSQNAMLTVPPILQIIKSPIHGYGVFAKEELKKNMRFGPYKGERIPARELKGMKDSGFAFQVNDCFQV